MTLWRLRRLGRRFPPALRPALVATLGGERRVGVIAGDPAPWRALGASAARWEPAARYDLVVAAGPFDPAWGCSLAPGGRLLWRVPGRGLRTAAQHLVRAGWEVVGLWPRRWADGGPWVLARPAPRPPRPGAPRVKISYRATVGDLVALTAAVAAYRAAHPEVHLTIEVPHPEVFLGHPAVDAVAWTPQPDAAFERVHRLRLPIAAEDRGRSLQASAAAQLGVPLLDPRPVLRLFPWERAAAEWRFGRAAGRLVLVAPFSRWPSREWPRERWRALVATLRADGHDVWLVDRGDRPPLPGARDLGGATTLRELAALIERADLLVAVDSAAAHLAAATGTRAVVLFGPILARTRVVVPWVTGLQADTDCVGCWHDPSLPPPPRTCPRGHHRCLRDLDLARVLAVVRAALAAPQGAA